MRRRSGARWIVFGSRCLRGVLPTPGRGLASLCRAARRRRSKRSLPMPSQVNALTGASPTVALHVLWDLPGGKADVPAIQALEKKYGVKAGGINPNLFQDAEYKFGSIANPSAEIRGIALAASAGFGGDWQGAGVEGRFAVDCGWVELSGNAEHAPAHRVDGRGAGSDPCGAGRGPADAGGVQAV